jgi:hypothetical protein
MSKHASFSRHARRVTDEATSAVYTELGHDAESTETFTELLQVARTRSSFLTYPTVRDGMHVQVETLKHLSRFARRFVRSPATWPGNSV